MLCLAQVTVRIPHTQMTLFSMGIYVKKRVTMFKALMFKGYSHRLCVLYTVYCILYSLYCILYSLYCILYTV